MKKRIFLTVATLGACLLVSSAFAFSWTVDHLHHLARGLFQPEHTADMAQELAPFIDTTTGEHEGTLISKLVIDRHRGSMQYTRRNVEETEPYRWSYYSEMVDTIMVNEVAVSSYLRVSVNHLSQQPTVVTTPFHPVYPGRFVTDCTQQNGDQTVEDRLITQGESDWSAMVHQDKIWPVNHFYNGLKLSMDVYYRTMPTQCGAGSQPDLNGQPVSVLVPWTGKARVSIPLDQYQVVMLSNQEADLWVP
jgi:hypothetical protein